MESVLKLDYKNIIKNLDNLLDMNKKVPKSLKKDFTRTVVKKFLEKRGIKVFNIDIYYDKLLKIVNNLLVSDFQVGGAGDEDKALVPYEPNRRNSKNLINIILTFAWLILNFTSVILGVKELINLTKYQLINNDDQINFNVQTANNIDYTPSSSQPDRGLTVYNEANGEIVPFDAISTDGSDMIITPSQQEINEVLTLGQLITFNPEIGEILTRNINRKIAKILQMYSSRIYDRIHENYHETSGRAAEVMNPSILFAEDPISWFSVGVGSVMSYLRYETTEEIIRLKQQMENELIIASRELEDFRTNIMRTSHGQLRFIIRRLEIALILIKFGVGGLLATLVEYLRRRMVRNSTHQLTVDGQKDNSVDFEILEAGRKKRKRQEEKLEGKIEEKLEGKIEEKLKEKMD